MTSISTLAASPAQCAYDVFNGDADGICALHQLRLAYPKDALQVTGVKRDVALLERVAHAEQADVTVLDVSLDTNVTALQRILDAGGRVTYFDHHSARRAFQHPRLHLFLDEAPEVCTSILVDRHLKGRFRQWAIVAAFGDNLPASGRPLARSIGMDTSHMHALKKLGEMLNYNAYGECVADLHVAPDQLYRAIHQFVDPFDFIEASRHYRLLEDGYLDDAARMVNLMPAWQSAAGAIYILPGEPWARRISGVFANKLVSSGKAQSYAVLTEKEDSGYVVSVRAGQPAFRGANGLCEQFPTGGGRKAAAGINSLPATELDHFIKAFSEYFSGSLASTSAGAALASQG